MKTLILLSLAAAAAVLALIIIPRRLKCKHPHAVPKAIPVQAYGVMAPVEWLCPDCKDVSFEMIPREQHRDLIVRQCPHDRTFIQTPDQIDGLPRRVEVRSVCSECEGWKPLIVSYEDYATIHGLKTLKNIVLDRLPDDVVVYDSLNEG